MVRKLAKAYSTSEYPCQPKAIFFMDQQNYVASIKCMCGFELKGFDNDGEILQAFEYHVIKNHTKKIADKLAT